MPNFAFEKNCLVCRICFECRVQKYLVDKFYLVDRFIPIFFPGFFILLLIWIEIIFIFKIVWLSCCEFSVCWNFVLLKKLVILTTVCCCFLFFFEEY